MNHPEYAFQVFWSTEDEAYLAVPYELPGCMADGKTVEEAIVNLRVVIQEWLETARLEGRPIPEPLTVQSFEQIVATQQGEFRQLVESQFAAAVEAALQQIQAAHSQQQMGYGNRLAGVSTLEHCGRGNK